MVTAVALPRIPGKDTLVVKPRLGAYAPQYPDTSFLPSETEHLLLNGMKFALEKSCYLFTQTWLPYVIEARGWSHVSHLELHLWQGKVRKYKVPREALDLDQPLSELFDRISAVRHCAVHSTNKVPITSLQQMLQDAISITKGLRDEKRTTELSKWNELLSQLLPVDQELAKSQRSQLQITRDRISDLEKQLSEERAKEDSLICGIVSDQTCHTMRSPTAYQLTHRYLGNYSVSTH